MIPLDNGYDLAALFKYRNDLFRIADIKFFVNSGESIQQFVDKDHDRQIVFLQFLPEPFLLSSRDKRFGPIQITGIIIGYHQKRRFLCWFKPAKELGQDKRNAPADDLFRNNRLFMVYQIDQGKCKQYS